MNGPIRKVTMFVALLMAALLLNLTYISAARTESLNQEPRNRRVRDAEFSQNRGAILVGTTAIAQSVPRTGRFPYVRTYSDGPMWSTVTGWYSYDFARAGLEDSYNQQLAGTSAAQSVNRIVDTLSGRASQGAALSTTLHPAAQQAAVEALGSNSGAVVAMNYATGEVLALVSTPTYDPNRLATVDLAAEQQAWQDLLADESEPLKNRATREVFPPGSTFKLITAAAALEDGMVPDSMLEAPEKLQLPGSTSTVGNSTDCGGTSVSLQQALSTSCNTAFGTLAMGLGSDKLRDMAEAFGFNAEPQLDLPSATSRFPGELDQAQTALASIGQYEVAASPLQMVQVAAAIANDGTLMRPHLVSKVTNNDLTVLSSTSPTQQSQPVSASTAKLMQQMMEQVVSDGTGTRAQIDGLTVGGKTGTAQTDPSAPPYAWFVGYAKQPQVAVAVFVEKADISADDISGGRVAAPIFKAVVEAIR